MSPDRRRLCSHSPKAWPATCCRTWSLTCSKGFIAVFAGNVCKERASIEVDGIAAFSAVDLDRQEHEKRSPRRELSQIGQPLDEDGAPAEPDPVRLGVGLKRTHAVVVDPDAPNASLVDEVFVRHSSGVRALLAPDNLAMVPSIDPDRVARVVDQLRPHFQYIVCDLWSSLEDLTLATLRMADRIVLVTTPELPSLRSLRRVMAATGLLLQDDRTLLVANRVPGKAGIGVGEIERGLGRTIAATIPSEGVGITEAINRGISILDDRARAKAGSSYKKLAELIVHGLEPTAIGQAGRRPVPAAELR